MLKGFIHVEKSEARPDLRLGFSYGYAISPNMKVDQNRGVRPGELSGEFNNFSISTIAFNAAYQF